MVHSIINPSPSLENGFSPQLSSNRHAGVLTSDTLLSRSRSWALGLPLQCTSTYAKSPLVIAIGGGKGGVGKSMIAANLGAKFARLGFRVVSLDLDCGGSNLHTYYGVPAARQGLSDFIVKGDCSLSDVFTPTQIEGLSIGASQKDDAWSVADALLGDGMNRLWKGLESLADCPEHQKDIVIFDLGAGTARHTVDLFCSAHVGVITALPEPTSVENSYMFLRTTLLRLLENAGTRLTKHDDVQSILRFMTEESSQSTARSYTDKLRVLYKNQPNLIGTMATALSGRTIGILMNQTRSQADVDIGKAMEMAAQRYFGFTAQSIGSLNYDEAAWKSLRNKRLLLTDFPQALISKKFGDVAAAILKSVGISSPL